MSPTNRRGGMNVKCVIVIDRDLPPGLAANAAAALGMSLGAQVDGLIGPDVADADGVVHRGEGEPSGPDGFVRRIDGSFFGDCFREGSGCRRHRIQQACPELQELRHLQGPDE